MQTGKLVSPIWNPDGLIGKPVGPIGKPVGPIEKTASSIRKPVTQIENNVKPKWGDRRTVFFYYYFCWWLRSNKWFLNHEESLKYVRKWFPIFLKKSKISQLIINKHRLVPKNEAHIHFLTVFRRAKMDIFWPKLPKYSFWRA